MINKLEIKDFDFYNRLKKSNIESYEIAKSKLNYRILLGFSILVLLVLFYMAFKNSYWVNYIYTIAIIYIILITIRLIWIYKKHQPTIVISNEGIKLIETKEKILWREINYISIIRIEDYDSIESILRIVTAKNTYSIDVDFMSNNVDEIETILLHYSSLEI